MIKIFALSVIIGFIYIGYLFLIPETLPESYEENGEAIVDRNGNESLSSTSDSNSHGTEYQETPLSAAEIESSNEFQTRTPSESIYAETIVDTEAAENLNSQTAENYFIDLASVPNEVGLQVDKAEPEPKSLLVEIESTENKTTDKKTDETSTPEKKSDPQREIASEPEEIKVYDYTGKE